MTNKDKSTTPPPELLALSERATQGEWTLANYDDYNDFDGHSRVILGDDRRIGVIQVQSADDEEDNANAELSVAAVNWFRNQDWTTTPNPELPESVVTLIGKFNAAIEAVARRSDEIGEEEWYEAPALADMHHISGADAELIVLCSPANLHVLTTYAAEYVRAANARAEGLERTLNAAAVHLASIGHPVDAKGNYCKGGEWTFAEAVPMTANEIEVKAAFLLINSALSGLRPIDAAQAVRSEASDGDNDGR